MCIGKVSEIADIRLHALVRGTDHRSNYRLLLPTNPLRSDLDAQAGEGRCSVYVQKLETFVFSSEDIHSPAAMREISFEAAGTRGELCTRRHENMTHDSMYKA